MYINLNNKKSLIDVVRGIAIFLVVMGHLIQYTILPSGYNFFDSITFRVIYSFHMPLFIFISGYLLAFSLKNNKTSKVILSRFKGLLVPYLSWSSIDLIIYLTKEALYKDTFSLINILKRGIKSIIIFPGIWFLFTLFMLNLILIVTIRIKNKVGNVAYLISILAVIIFPSYSFFNIYYIKWFYIFFLSGYLININSIYFKNINSYFTKEKMIILVIIFILLLSLWNNNDYIYNNRMRLLTNNYIYEILRYIYRYCTAFIGIGLAFYLGKLISKIKISKIFILLSNYSLDIYLIQRYVIEVLYYNIMKWVYFNFFNNYLEYSIIIFISSLLLSIIICLFISKYVIRKNNILKLFLLSNRN